MATSSPVKATFYEIATGKVKGQIFASPEEIALNTEEGQAAYMDGWVDGDMYYFPNGVKTQRDVFVVDGNIAHNGVWISETGGNMYTGSVLDFTATMLVRPGDQFTIDHIDGKVTASLSAVSGDVIKLDELQDAWEWSCILPPQDGSFDVRIESWPLRPVKVRLTSSPSNPMV